MKLTSFAAAAFILLAACQPVEHKLTYKVTGDPDWEKNHPKNSDRWQEQFVRIRLDNRTGGTDDFMAVIPWSRDEVVHDGDIIRLSAQLNSRDESDVGCEIYLDGALVKQSHSTGDFAIADCLGKI